MQHTQGATTEENFHTVLYPTVYVELVKFIYETLSPMAGSITAQSLKHLYERSKSDIYSFMFSENQYREITKSCISI